MAKTKARASRKTRHRTAERHSAMQFSLNLPQTETYGHQQLGSMQPFGKVARNTEQVIADAEKIFQFIVKP